MSGIFEAFVLEDCSDFLAAALGRVALRGRKRGQESVLYRERASADNAAEKANQKHPGRYRVRRVTVAVEG